MVINAVKLNNQPMITGWNKFIFCFNDTTMIAASVAAKVAIRQGTKISTGFAAFMEALAAMTATGMMLNPDACKLRNMICALEAVVLFGLSSCKLSIVFNPNGVAA